MKSWSLDLLLIPLAAVALAAAAQLSIQLPEDVSVVPITGQTLAILIMAELMDWKKATASVILYLTLGILGLPFFAGFRGGWEVFSGVSLGYFIGFVMAVAVFGCRADQGGKGIGPTAIRSLLASLLILAIGWLGLLRFLDPGVAFSKGIVPYLPGALIKWFLAVVFVSLARKYKTLMGKLESGL